MGEIIKLDLNKIRTHSKDKYDEEDIEGWIDDLDVQCKEIIKGLKVLGIHYIRRSNIIKFQKNLNFDEKFRIVEDYSDVINKNYGLNIQYNIFKKSLKNESRAKKAYEYYQKSGACRTDNEDVLTDEMVWLAYVIIDILRDYQKNNLK